MENTKNISHPKGLYLLFFVEMWERFAFYGMRALIILYMIQHLLYSTTKAGNIYGLYTGLVYLTPLIGGYLADRFLGQRKCITLGAICMCTGLFMLASGINSIFLLALFLMIIANGFFKSNISSTLGLLYGDDNERKDAGFTIFYMGINLGAFLSPLICGTLAIKYGYNYGFAAAGIGMLIGLTLYKLFENKLLGEYGIHPVTTNKNDLKNKETLTPEQKTKLKALFILLLFTVVFWCCYEQAGSSLTLFAEYSTNRVIFGKTIPTGYFQSLNPLFIIMLAPMASAVWGFLNKKGKEPSSVHKFAFALILMSISYIILSFAGYFSGFSKVSPLWLVSAYFIMTIGEICLSPIGLSLVSKLAPKKFLSLIMGTWFLSSFIGNLFAGVWGGKYGTISNTILFATLACCSIITMFIFLIIMPKLNKALNT